LRKNWGNPNFLEKIPEFSLIIIKVLLLVIRTPWEAKGFGNGLAEPVVWLGLEDCRGLFGGLTPVFMPNFK